MAKHTNGRMPSGILATRRTSRKPVSLIAGKAKEVSATIHFSVRDGLKADPAGFPPLVKQLETALGMPVWLLVQNGSGPFSQIDIHTFKGFQKFKNDIPNEKPAALLIESPGGSPEYAYYIARYFQRRCHFVTIVPQYAKSAATLLTLAGKDVIMGRDAEIGPLDVQLFDTTREQYGSALNTLQSLERLHADTMTIVDEMMQLLILRTGKKVDSLLATVLHHGTEFVRPLVEKIDTLDYTEKSRAMKMAEEYAIRLMSKAGYDLKTAEQISRTLVTDYPDHGFIIDSDEAKKLLGIQQRSEIGLRIKSNTPEIEDIFDKMTPFLDGLRAVGRLK